MSQPPSGWPGPEWWAELDEANREIRSHQAAPPGSRLVGYAGGYWRELQLTVFEWLGRGHWLTQFGLKGNFRSEPRYDFPIHETALSMSLGRKSPEEMMRLVMRRPLRRRDRAQVRYFISDNLWNHQYSVALTPNDTDKEHVSVYCALPRQQIDVIEAMKCWRQQGRVTMDELVEEVHE